jgi:FMN phosphatase YigB (HAD superfamily)
LIIFDLDDTLIDTSGSVTPHKLEAAVRLMMADRLADLRADLRSELREICAINERVFKTPHAIEEYGKQKGIALETIDRAIQTLYDPLPHDFQVACTPNAKEILEYYRSRCPIALVTGGNPSFQLDKLKKAGLEPSIFSKIAIPEDSIKKPFYREFAKEFLAAPSDVWVCGDRIAMDLAPAHELKFHTVHMRWGRGRQLASEPWIEHTISELSELRNIIR